MAIKLVTSTQKPIQEDGFHKYLGQIRQLLPKGDAGEQSITTIIGRFSRSLDNRYIMLRDLRLERPGMDFPLILIGPPGLFLLNVSQVSGNFRVKESSWWELNKTTLRYNPAHPNLIRQSQDYAQKLGAILDALGKTHPEIIPVLIFANPGVHLETTNPAIRIVRMDGVDSLIANIRASREVLKTAEIIHLSASLEVIANPEKAIPIGEGEDIFGRDLLLPEKKARYRLPTISISKVISLPSLKRKLPISRKQWTAIVLTLSVFIVVLFGAILLTLLST